MANAEELGSRKKRDAGIVRSNDQSGMAANIRSGNGPSALPSGRDTVPSKKKRKSVKPQIELLIDEVSKTQQKIQTLQSTLDNVQSLMSQEYATFHNAIHEEKQRTELLSTRVDNHEVLYHAEMAALQENLKGSEERVNYKMNVMFQDIRDDVAKLQATVNSLGAKWKTVYGNNDSEDDDQPAPSLMKKTTIGVFQILTDFLLWTVAVVNDPMENVYHFALVLLVIFVIYHVCGFFMCNVLCASYQSFNIFAAIDNYRSKSSTAKR